MGVLYEFISTVQQKKQQHEEAMGKSRGGLSTKIHVAVDALGNPVRLILTEGQDSEYIQVQALIEGFHADSVLAGKGYDSDSFVSVIVTNNAVPVIPSQKKQKDCQRL